MDQAKQKTTKKMVEPATRSETEVWLVGQRVSEFIGTKLPSTKEVLSVFFHFKAIVQEQTRIAATKTADLLLTIWDQARIPTRKKQHVIEKIVNCFQQWQSLKKLKYTNRKPAQQKRQEWKESIADLFDIAHANAEQMITIKEDLEFLKAQRQKDRSGKIAVVDVMLTRAEKRAATAAGSAMKRRGKKNLIDDNVAATLDVAKVSGESAALILSPVIKRAGVNLEKYNINM